MLNMTISRSPIVLLLALAWPFSLVAQCDISKCGCMKRMLKHEKAYLAYDPEVEISPGCGSIEGGTLVTATVAIHDYRTPDFTPIGDPPPPEPVRTAIFEILGVYVGGTPITPDEVKASLVASEVAVVFRTPSVATAGTVSVHVFYNFGYSCEKWLGGERSVVLPGVAIGEFEYINVRYPVVQDVCPGILSPTACACLPPGEIQRNVEPPCCEDGANTLTIRGSGFHRDSNGDIPMVWIDGIERSSPNVVWVSESELRVVLPEKTFTDAGYVEVMVRNPPFTCGNIDCATDECGVFYIPQGGCTTGPSDGPEYQTGFVGRGPHYVDTGNVIDDPSGHKDVVVASVTDDGGMLTILEGNGDGSVTSTYGMDAEKASERQWKLSGVPTAIDVGDLNGDGFDDAAIAIYDRDDVEVWQSLGADWSSGRLLELRIIGSPDDMVSFVANPTDVKMADVVGDGSIPDILLASPLQIVIRKGSILDDGNWTVHGFGDCNIDILDEAGYPCNPFRLATGDIDNDGTTDVATITDHGTVVLYAGQTANLSPSRIDGMNLGSMPVDVKVIPIDPDDRLGLAVLRQDRSIDLINYDPATRLLVEPPVNIPLTERYGTPTVLTKGDFNDGNEGDLVVAYSDGSVEVVFLDFTAGPRLLGTQVLELPDQAPISDLAADKLNADPTTREDLVIAPGNSSHVVIAINKGSGFE